MKANEIRKRVSSAYARAITSEHQSCCGPQGCCAPDSSTAIAELGTYKPEEIKAHQSAASSSFGCGNPLAFSDVREGETVLDLGSGAGLDLLIAAEKVGPSGQVIGVDMTEEMIDKARDNIKTTGAENIEIRYGLIEDLPVEKNSVDWVISNCVINLSPEKAKVFKEIYRVLKPGGRMRISDIVVEELPLELRNHQGLYNSCIAGAVSEEEYLAGLAEEGLTEIKVEERFVYDAAQLTAIFADQQAGLIDLFDGLPEEERTATIDRLIKEAAGKVWSAKISARKA
ncbi:MAG: arsenite methyltransferase [Desulfobulbaceae bacterium]|nr:arsenite methyltransferase [Desulfobulbaceae bacterium]